MEVFFRGDKLGQIWKAMGYNTENLELVGPERLYCVCVYVVVVVMLGGMGE